MPSNSDFTLSVLVGGCVLPEYEKDGLNYVECNLFTPYSFRQCAEEEVDGEPEVQRWPVTPFTLCIQANPQVPHCYYRIYIDGQKVASKSVLPGEKKNIKGFRDGNAVREFLFSLPRYARNEGDRIGTEHESRVGCIEVECYNGQLRRTKSAIRSKQLMFEQANKKDCGRVTKGKYLMATTKAGRVVSLKQSRRSTDYWDVISLRSKICIKYNTADTLTEMGFSVVPIPFPKSTVNLSTQGRQTSGTPVRFQGRRNNQTIKNEPNTVLSPEGVDLSLGLAGSSYTKLQSEENNSDPTRISSSDSGMDNRQPVVMDHCYTYKQAKQSDHVDSVSNLDVPVVKEEVELSSENEIMCIDLTENKQEVPVPEILSQEVIVID